ncbi:helix-turn-helix domain-containing protein [Alicyclobacillus sp. ALC3]|uniref:helix-turn-helix domain-containing protein n=1 Tax=Alicyclobacillus sp. ALC3 TaxID=2796143 RepID=UPI00237990A8|nr:helix-turn-helix domain-containing protein [Alicyclobacillus sp. ALC3]WDL97771.1 helix-turn-helix domain-containing protein [Alicyclobacillus sp. ALC3]
MIEDLIRGIVAEELQKIKRELLEELRSLQTSTSLVDLYGETLTVDGAAEILKVSKSKVYELARSPTLPCKKAGSRVIIPTRRFFEWLNESTD